MIYKLQQQERAWKMSAFLLRRVGLLDQAEATLAEGRQLREDASTLGTEEGATLLRETGEVMLRRGDRHGALEVLEQARRVHARLGTLYSPQGAAVLMRIGGAKAATGDNAGALEDYE